MSEPDDVSPAEIIDQLPVRRRWRKRHPVTREVSEIDVVVALPDQWDRLPLARDPAWGVARLDGLVIAVLSVR